MVRPLQMDNIIIINRKIKTERVALVKQAK